MDSSEMSNLDINIGSGFNIWEWLVNNKTQIQVHLLKKLRKLIPSNVFFMKFCKHLQQGGSSKFQMVFSGI